VDSIASWLLVVVAAIAVHSYRLYTSDKYAQTLVDKQAQLNNCINMLRAEQARTREYDIPGVAGYLDIPIANVCRLLKEKDDEPTLRSYNTWVLKNSLRGRVARHIASHLGPAFEDLPKDHAGYMKIRYTSDHVSDETQECMLELADELLDLIKENT